MKKITLVLFTFLSFISWSQNPNYRYHELQDLGPNIEWAIAVECTQHYSPVGIREVNLRQNFKLQVGKIYKADLGLNYGNFGTRYYKVTYAGDVGTDMGDEIDTPPDFGAPITDLCNSLSWKFARPILLGSTLQEAQNNFCSNLTVNNTREKINIKIAKPLASGNVYFMDFGKGSNYYLIDGSNVESGDADYDLDTTNSNSVFSSITFNCQKPDLRATEISLTNNNNSYRGATKSIDFTISQLGTKIQNADTKFTFFLTQTRGIINPNDIKVTSEVWGAETMNLYYGTTIRTAFFTVPYNISNGAYYVTIKITNSEDFNPKNDIATTSSRFTIIDGKEPTTPTIPTTPTTPTPTPKPDLVIDPNNTIIFSECSCSAPLSGLKDKRHLINNKSGILNLSYIAVKNTGNATSSPTNVTFYLSLDSTLDTADLKSNGSSIKINAISPGESFVVSGGDIHFSDFGNSGTTFSGNWNLLMVIDDSKTITESNKNNNVTAIPITFYNPSGKSASSKLEVDKFMERYSIAVYNFQGQRILTKEVNTKEEENNFLQSLKKGFYIVKSNDQTRKIYIE